MGYNSSVANKKEDSPVFPPLYLMCFPPCLRLVIRPETAGRIPDNQVYTKTHNYVNFQLKKSDKVEGNGKTYDGDYQKLRHPWPLKCWKIFS